MTEVISDLARPPGDFIAEQKDMSRRMQEASTARRSERTVISKGAFRVIEGANILVEDGGHIRLHDGGRVVVTDGGQIITVHQSGIASTWLGYFRDGGIPGNGIIVQRADAYNIFAAVTDEGTDTATIRVGGDPAYGLRSADIFNVHAEYVGIVAHGDKPLEVFHRGTGEVRVGGYSERVLLAHSTVGSGDACVIQSSGLIQRVASSQRYKTNIAPFDVTPECVLAADPVTFEDRAEAEQAPESEAVPRHVGMIAEQLVECGLDALVSRNDAGDPESIRYDRLPVAQQIVLRDHEARVVELERQVSEQAAVIADLSARLTALETQGGAGV